MAGQAYNDKVMDQFSLTPRIGLSGKMRSGKDSAAKVLVEMYGFTKFSFADRLKQLAAELFDVEPGTKSRKLLTVLGRKLCEIDPEVWVRQVLKRMPADLPVVVSDVRFPYEIDALREAGFYLARIDTPENVRLQRLLRSEGSEGARNTTELMADPSETALDSYEHWDFRLNGIDYGPLSVDIQRMMAEVTEGMNG